MEDFAREVEPRQELMRGKGEGRDCVATDV